MTPATVPGVRRALAAIGVLGLIIASCATPERAAPDTRSAKSVAYDVQVDATTPAFNLATVTYFPNALTAHPGDRIRFTAIDRGEPHTVTLGSIADDAVATYEKLPKDAPPPDPLPTALLRLPAPFAGQLPSTMDLRRSAWQPCFLASGDPPTKDACTKEQQKQPDFGGHTWYNSGFLPGGAVFSVKLAADIKPGTYRYLCMFHGPGMSGTITVVDASEPTPSPDETKAKGADQLKTIVKTLEPVVAKAKATVVPGEVLSGFFASDHSVPGSVTEFFPKVATVPVGGSLTWRIAFHTLSFNAPSDAVDLVVTGTDGIYHLNNKAIFPTGWPGTPIFVPGLDPAPGQPPPTAPPPGGGGPPPPQALDAGVWDGKGFRSSGLVFAGSDIGYRITFSQPGTYTYRCLIHVDMEGTVKVSQ